MENGTNTTKDFLWWVVPVGILTEKDKHIAGERPQASLFKEITSVSNSQENNILYVETLSTIPLPSQDILYSDLNLQFSILQLHTEIPLGIQMFLMLTFMFDFIGATVFTV